MNTNDKDRINQELDGKIKQLKNEIQYGQDRVVKEHIKVFIVGYGICALIFIIFWVWHNKG